MATYVTARGAVPKLAKGSKGKAVKMWQYFLTLEGYKLSVDGGFGATTEKKTKDYQREHGLTQDGAVGGKTWSAMLNCLRR